MLDHNNPAAVVLLPFLNIRNACLEIAYDNGGVHRERSVQQVRHEIDSFLSSRSYSDHFAAIDSWLSTLNTAQLETVCNGEGSEAAAIVASAPAFTDQLLEEYFEEVC